MKTIKFISVILSLLFLVGSVKADKPKNRAAFTMKFSIDAFIEADARGVCDGLTDIIAEKATFGIMSGDKIFAATKKQVINQMQSLRGVQQNCTTDYAILETREHYALIKVEMKYPAFTRVNYITMNECSDGWKIVNVTSIFAK